MKPILFELGPINIYGYGAMIGIGIIAAFLMAMKRSEKYKLNADNVFNIGVIALIGGVIGSKLLFFITEFEYIIENPKVMLNFAEGFVVYGGIIGGIIAGFLYCKIKKLDFLAYFDLIIPSIALAQGFGRIGCFLTGCCYGRETHSWIGITFHESLYGPNGVSLIPTQLISSGLNFIHAFILVMIARKKKNDGVVAACYLIFYSVGRFCVEIFRNDPRGSVGALSTSQFISIFMFIIGVIMLIIVTKKKTLVKETIVVEEVSKEENIESIDMTEEK